MNPNELKKRTKQFGLNTICLVQELKNRVELIIGDQLLRAATSVGANYRSACRAKSKADFIYKIQLVEEEADESAYWLELLYEANLINKERITALLNEANELTAIFTSSARTAKNKKN